METKKSLLILKDERAALFEHYEVFFRDFRLNERVFEDRTRIQVTDHDLRLLIVGLGLEDGPAITRLIKRANRLLNTSAQPVHNEKRG